MTRARAFLWSRVMGVRAETLGAALRRHRRAAGLSQDQLAQRSGVSVRTIRNIERGRVRAPRRTSTEALADALRLVGGGRELFVACGQPVVDPGRDDPVRVPLTP